MCSLTSTLAKVMESFVSAWIMQDMEPCAAPPTPVLATAGTGPRLTTQSSWYSICIRHCRMVDVPSSLSYRLQQGLRGCQYQRGNA